METREFALIAFTILAQMSVGSFLVLGIVHFFAKSNAGEKVTDQLSDRALLAIFPVLALGLLASLLHLGNPINAYKAVSNLGTSWLSREIFFGVLFAATGAIFALMQWRKLANFAVRNSLALLAALFGIALVYSMSNVYMLPTQPSWDLITTPLSFFTTTLLLGVLAVGGAFVATYAHDRRKDPKGASELSQLSYATVKWTAFASIVLVGVEFVLVPLNVALLAGGAAPESAGLLVSEFGLLFGLRLVLVFVGAGVLGLFTYRAVQTGDSNKVVASLSHSGFLLVFIGELLSRFLFYATAVKFGLQ